MTVSAEITSASVVYPPMDGRAGSGIIRWTAKNRTFVKKGQEIGLIETSEVILQLDAPQDGYLRVRYSSGLRVVSEEHLAEILDETVGKPPRIEHYPPASELIYVPETRTKEYKEEHARRAKRSFYFRSKSRDGILRWIVDHETFVQSGTEVLEIIDEASEAVIATISAPITGFLDHITPSGESAHEGMVVAAVHYSDPVTRAELISFYNEIKDKPYRTELYNACGLTGRGGKDFYVGETTIIKWLVDDLSNVKEGQPLVVYSKDGEVLTTEARYDGTFCILVPEGKTVECNTEIGFSVTLPAHNRPSQTTPFGKPYKAPWEGCVAIPVVRPAQAYSDAQIRLRAQQLFNDTQPRGHISLEKCSDTTVAFFTAWAKRDLER